MIIGILKEKPPEMRVALTPENSKTLIGLGAKILVETGAGIAAYMHDSEYEKNGATIVSRQTAISGSDCILTIYGMSPEEYDMWGDGKTIIGHFSLSGYGSLPDQAFRHNINVFSLDLLPRTTLAQSMDILSSMATVAGYKAVIEAANHLPRFFPMFMSAAGTIRPARVLILGAGVAGLQALATARRLGAVVEVFDVRSVVKEEVQSLGGKFIEVAGAQENNQAGGYAVEQQDEYKLRQAELIHDHAIRADVVICTAQIPGKRAPLLLFKKTVEAMPAGSVIVDLAAASGGNCELTGFNETIVLGEVSIIGKIDLPASLPMDASRMFSNNMLNFMKLLIDGSGNLSMNWENEIIAKTCIAREGSINHG